MLAIDTPTVVGPPKTTKGRRVVEMSALAVDALLRHRERQTVTSIAGQVFTRPDGRVLPVQAVYAGWHRLLRRAGVPVVRPHDARHSAASLLLSQGVHPKIVSELLGHANVSITLDLYSHVTPSMQRAAVNAMDALLGGGRGHGGGQTPAKPLATNTESDCRGWDSNPYKVALTSPSS